MVFPRSGRTVRIAVRTVLLACVASLVAVAPAAAQETPPEFAPTMVVLDASGSMTGADPSGGTKMAAAQRAVHTMVEATSDGAPVGLGVYGTGTGSSDAERERGCQDVSIVSPPAALDRAKLTGAVDVLTPRGYTPIGKSLQVAVEQLPEEGPRSVVLVSDGEDTCAPPEPCEVVRTLAGAGVDLVVHAVGFGVDDAARSQLSCVAQSTGGTYTDALDGESLSQVLPRITATALRNYEPVGTPITGTPAVADAPLAVPGQHLDTIGQKETRHYAVDVPAGATAHVSATVAYPRVSGVNLLDDANTVKLRTYGEGGEDCHEFEVGQQGRSSDGAPLSVATTWTGATEERTGNDARDRCKGGGRYTFALQWDRVSQGVPARLPVELLVGIEPGVTDPGPAAVLPAIAPPAPGSGGAARPVPAGGSFATASTLDGPGSYTDVVQRGEFVFYRVRLDYGQGLAYRIRFGESPGRGPDNLSVNRTVLYAPTREDLASESTSYDGGGTTLPREGAVDTVPVRYLNRDATDGKVKKQSAPGWYYIAVAVSPTNKEGSLSAGPVPIHLDLAVGGNVEPGPTYATAAQGAPFDPAAGPGGEDPAASGEEAGGSVVSPVVVVVGLFALATVVAGAVLAGRRRRRG